jgi:hypothetical protein
MNNFFKNIFKYQKTKACIIIVFIMVFPFMSFSQVFNQIQKIVTNDRMTYLRLGNAVAMSGDYAVLSAFLVNGDNSVYIYIKDNLGQWVQSQKIDSPEAINVNSFGHSVDIFGDYLIVGDDLYRISSPSNTFGAAYIYQKDLNNIWQFKQRILASDGQSSDQFGFSVSIDSNICFISAIQNNSNRGAVYVFERNSSDIWVETKKIVASDIAPNDFFSYSISNSNNTLVIGAPGEDHDETGNVFLESSGSVYVFEKAGINNWLQVQKIVAPDRSINGIFGTSVALLEDRIIIGAGSINRQFDNAYYQTCGAYIYEKNPLGIWELVQKLNPPDPADHLGFGNAVGLSDDYAIVSAIDEGVDELGNTVGPYMGAVYAYKRQPDGAYQQVQRIIASDRADGDYFGRSVAIEGSTLMVGAWREDEDENGQNTILEAGSVYIFEACPASLATDTQIACGSYSWIDGLTYSSSTQDETFIIPNALGCDSIVTLNLTVHPIDSIIEAVVECDVYNWNSLSLTQSGSYVSKGKNQYGCDSTFTLNLTIHNATNNIEQKYACDSITWNGTTYDNSGIHTYTTTNIYGCDSTEILNLTIYPSSQSNINFTTCDAYTWNGQTYVQSGIYTYPSTNIYGCDSITTLNLTIHPTITETIQETQCDAYTWNGITYTESGSYDYQTLSVLNCDSIATLALTIHPSSQESISYSSCDPYLWNGTTYTESGTYSYQTQNIFGCDSTTTLDLTIHPNSNNTTTQTACDTYTWSGTTYDQSGTYTTTSTNVFGCDSISTLNLTIHPSQNISTTETACASFLWQGTTYDQSGIYTYQTQNTFGCDSTITLNLTIHQESNTDITTTACDSLIYQGQTITESGSYSFSLQNTNGCDSTINLNLTISAVRNENTQSACGTYLWPVTGEAYTQSGTYQAMYTNVQGCDSTYLLNLTIHPKYNQETSAEACAKYLWSLNNQTYTQSGQHSVTLRTSQGCDSIITLDVTIHPEFEYRDTIITSEPYLWPINNTTYESSGIYTETFSTDLSCDSIHYLYLTISIDTDIHVPNIISPDGPNSQFTLFGSSISIIQDLSVYDRWGNQVFHRKSFPPNDSTQGWDGKYLGKNLTPGVYTYSAQLILTDGTTISKYGDVTIIR